MQTSIFIGIGAGLASAVLYASAWTGTVLGLFVLFFLSPLPVAIAGLGWGWRIGAIAAGVAAASLLVGAGMRSALVYLVALGAPAAVFSYFALLNRTHPDGNIEWYPVGRIVMWATVWSGITAAAGLLTIGTDFAAIKASILDLLEKSLFADGNGPDGRKISPEQKSAFAALMTAFMPWAFATTWFTVAILNLWAAGRITAASGLLARPWPDMAALSLPPGMGLAFGASILAMTLSDMPGLIASCFASAFLFAFMLVGLGLLHRLTRGTAIRPFLLGFVYAGLIFLPPFSNLLVAVVGVSEPYLRGRLPPSAPPPGPPDASNSA